MDGCSWTQTGRWCVFVPSLNPTISRQPSKHLRDRRIILHRRSFGAQELVDGVDLNVSFGIRQPIMSGEFPWSDCSSARYRQRLTLKRTGIRTQPAGLVEQSRELDILQPTSTALSWLWAGGWGAFRGGCAWASNRQSSMLFSEWWYSPAEFKLVRPGNSPGSTKNGSSLSNRSLPNVLDSQPPSERRPRPWVMKNPRSTRYLAAFPTSRYKHDL